MDVNKYIGNKIREFRERKNLTQEEIAEFLKTTPQTISRYEIGDRKTNQDILFKLAEYFQISINDFFPPLNIKNNTNSNIKYSVEETFEKVLKSKGIIDENDNISQDDFNRLMAFIDNNKDLLIKKDRD